MRTPTLVKPKTNSSTANPGKAQDSRPSDEVTIKTSFDDLKNPEARHLLRRQLTGHFPTTYCSPSQESANSGDMGIKDRLSRTASGSSLTVGQNPTAKSSSSSVDSEGPKRLSTVRENNATIDIEQAINLLQELKKNASPEDLVALHKALLPTRDSQVITSPKFTPREHRSSVSPAPLTRQRTTLPPGLATRGGFSEDLLRKQEDVKPPPKPRRAKTDEWAVHTHSSSKSSIAALDLADDTANPLHTRAETPHSEFPQYGAYRLGTLRVTNGTASPEPSISSVRNIEMSMAKANPPEELKSSTRHSAIPISRFNERFRSDDAVRETPSKHDRSLAFGKVQDQLQQRAARTKARAAEPRSRDLSQSRQFRQTRLDEPQSRQPLRLEINSSQQSLDMSRQSIEIRASIDDGKVSPMSTDMPRFQQRWSHRQSQISKRASEISHRASQISQEYMTDCDLPVSPYDDKTALLNFAQRLSTVYDSDRDDETAAEKGTREAALSKLNGLPEEKVVEQTVVVASPTVIEIPTPTSSQRGRPTPGHKVDSGYGSSDSSFRGLQRKVSREAGRPPKKHSNPEDALKEVDEDEGVFIDADDSRSLYSLGEILRSPDLLSGTSVPTTPSTGGSRKQSSVLKLSSVGKTSSLALVSVIAAQNSSDSIPTIGSLESSPVEQKAGDRNSRQSKKLQKPMPASVRKQRKVEMQKFKDERQALQVASGLIPTVPDPEAPSFFERPELGPSSLTLAEALTSIPPASSKEDLQRMPVELSSDNSGYVTDTSVVTPKRSLSRRRSESRGRRRSGTVRQTSGNEESGVQRSWSFKRTRSKSGTRSGTTTPSRNSFDIRSLSGKKESTDGNASGERLPAYSDFNSVARTLGSSPYDPSTTLFRRTVAVPGAVSHQIQSPHQISTRLSRSPSGGLRGMDSSMASELARMKSRDVAEQNKEEVYDRPRMATPRSSRPKGSRSNSAASTSVMVEDRFPDWQGKPMSRNQSPQRPQPPPPRPNSMYAESIPPLPEMPADTGVRALRADEMLAKRHKDSAQPTPVVSARSSEERPGDSTESVADAVKRAVAARKAQEAKQAEEEKKAARALPTGARQTTQDSLKVGAPPLFSRPSAESILIGVGSDVDVREQRPASSPEPNSQQAEQSGWEQQARLWAERRRSLGEQLGKPVEDDEQSNADTVTGKEVSPSPAIVISRYITPSAPENDARANAGDRPTDAAAHHADTYRNLIGDDKENLPVAGDESRPGSIATTHSIATFVTIQSHNGELQAQEDMAAVTSPYSVKSYHHTAGSQIERTRSPGGRVRTPSGNFHPYTPADAIYAERSRAQTLAVLMNPGADGRITQSLEMPRRLGHEKNDTLDSLIDRYSGGLQYGYEKGVGFVGSAGTRAGAEGGHRKSKQLSQDWGLDFSDIPVFLRKV